jgi:hypothetical protein
LFDPPPVHDPLEVVELGEVLEEVLEVYHPGHFEALGDQVHI